MLRHAADAGDGAANRRIIRVLAEEGNLRKLREHADTGDRYAMRQLADLLARRKDLPGLRSELNAGHSDDAATALIDLLGQHDPGKIKALWKVGLNAIGKIDQ